MQESYRYLLPAVSVKTMSATPTPEGSPTPQSPGPPLPDVHISPFSLTHEHRSLSSVMRSPTFREELDVLIQDQVKKGGNSSSLWALRQIADFLSHSSATLALPTSPSHLVTVTPINDLGSVEPSSMGKAERLQRCKLASTYRLLDLYGWARMAHGQLTLRVSKEQDHFLVLPDGLSYSEATALSLVKVNILGETVEQGSTALGIDVGSFSLHSAVYSARPDVRCLLHLHTPASVAVSAMKCGLLPLSHEALLVGEVAYYSYSGAMEETSDKVELQKSLGPTCKVLVLRNHGIVALGESVEEAFYILYHVQVACQIQVSAMCSAGGQKNLILLDRTTQRPCPTGTVGWAGSTFGPLHKSRLGEHEFEALMRTLDNLGYRTGYAYRFPLLLERARARREVEVAAAVTAFTLEGGSARRYLRPSSHTHKQRLEKTRWLNMPTSSRSQESPGHHRSTASQWLKAGEMRRGSGSAVKVENASQFVPLFTDPQEVLEIRKKIREQQRQETNWAGPQSHLLASVLCNQGLSQDSDSDLDGGPPGPQLVPELETPNPFSQLTDQELEEYRREVQRKQCLELDNGGQQLAPKSEATAKSESPTRNPSAGPLPPAGDGKPENEKQCVEEQEEGLEDEMKTLCVAETLPASPAALPAEPRAASPAKLPGNTPESSPSKKKKKFRTPSFLKRSKKQKEKAEV